MLAACRSLGRRGFTVGAAASERPAATHWSRFCANRLWTSDPRAHPGEFVEELSRIVSDGGYDVLIPGTDASLLAISRGREQVEPYVKVGLPAPEIVERSLSKVALGELAAKAGIPAPESAVCAEPEAALQAARRFGYPVMLKSADVVFDRDGELRRLGSAVVHDEPSLERLLPDYGDSWLVQRVQPGALLSFAGVIGGGRLLSHAVSRYRRTWPPEAGSVAFSETITPPAGLSERAHALVAAMGWEGIFELELLEGSGDSWSTLDMNPRVYGSLALADRAGAPLPVVWCDWLLGRRFAATAAQPGYRYRWDDAEIRRLGWLVGHRQVGSIPDLIRPRPRTVRAHLWRSDPLPLAARVLALLHHRGVRLRRPRALPRAAPAVTGTPHVSGQVEVAIVGAGPYGLSCAAFLRDAGVGVRSSASRWAIGVSTCPVGCSCAPAGGRLTLRALDERCLSMHTRQSGASAFPSTSRSRISSSTAGGTSSRSRLTSTSVASSGSCGPTATSRCASTTKTRCGPGGSSSRRASMGLPIGRRRLANCRPSSSPLLDHVEFAGSAAAGCSWLAPARARSSRRPS